MIRLRELDFLRGVAIILVFLRHIPLFPFTLNVGWIGVDLFFVLSGFLVSGLLFKEYIKFGNIRPKLFLIRRGFKIYPIYFLFYLPYIYSDIWLHKVDMVGLIADMTFTQNYVWGWGYAYSASWSLAVEEHFYFGFAFFLLLFIKYRKSLFQKSEAIQIKANQPEFIIATVLVICLIMRVISNIVFPQEQIRNFSMTHLRIDSLLFGVFVSYLFYFKRDYLNGLFKSHKKLLYIIAFAGLIWAPFIDPLPSFFVKTIGFTLVYISSGIILVAFLLEENIYSKLTKVFTPFLVNIVCKIGFCSYSIYIIHTFVISTFLETFIAHFKFYPNPYLFFMVAATISVLVGMLMTHTVEKYFLRLRNKYYPSRIL
jgi:peptidoglycan/LPS O-acetylase OafA/YrhL